MADLGVAPHGGEPFFDRLQELQPDVDVVVLPTATPSRAGEPPASGEETSRLVTRLDQLVDHLVRRSLLDSDVQPDSDRRTATWRRSGDDRFVRQVRARVVVATEREAIRLLEAMSEALRSDGWVTRPLLGRVPGTTASVPPSPEGRPPSVLGGPVGDQLTVYCTEAVPSWAVEVVVRSAPVVPDPGVLEQTGRPR